MKSNVDHQRIKDLIDQQQLIISSHARIRMFQRNIITDLIKNLILNGEIIEEYPDDFPCPSVLILGFIKEEPLHIVIAQCEDHVRIITVYLPDESKWISFRKRKE